MRALPFLPQGPPPPGGAYLYRKKRQKKRADFIYNMRWCICTSCAIYFSRGVLLGGFGYFTGKLNTTAVAVHEKKSTRHGNEVKRTYNGDIWLFSLGFDLAYACTNEQEWHINLCFYPLLSSLFTIFARRLPPFFASSFSPEYTAPPSPVRVCTQRRKYHVPPLPPPTRPIRLLG